MYGEFRCRDCAMKTSKARLMERSRIKVRRHPTNASATSLIFTIYNGSAYSRFLHQTMHLPAILAALALASPAAVSAAALDHSRSCIFACPQTTHAGAGWTSSLRAALLRCSYTDAASCLYARVRPPLSVSAPAPALTPSWCHADPDGRRARPRGLVGELCAARAPLVRVRVHMPRRVRAVRPSGHGRANRRGARHTRVHVRPGARMRVLFGGPTILPSQWRAERIVMEQDTGRLVGTTSFCPTQAVDTCRAARTTYAGEDDAQAAIRRRFRVQRRALSGARAHE